MSESVNPLVAAARDKFLASPQYADLADTIGSTPDGTPWVMTSDNRDGLPVFYGTGKAALTFGLGARSWSRSLDHSTAYPRLTCVVWTFDTGPSTAAAELAYSVGEKVIACFDAVPGVYAYWGDTYVLRCRWDGELTVFEAEGVDGLIRAHMGFEIETG